MIGTPGAILTLGLGGSPSLMVTLGYGIGAVVETPLIGRKYPRRHVTRPRKTLEDIDDIPKVIRKVRAEKQQITEELAEAQADLVSVQLMAHNTVKHAETIKNISSAITALESDLERVREEETVIMLALTLL